METITLGTGGPSASRLTYGCMRIVGDGSREARENGKRALFAASEHGYTHFDLADIYAGGQAEILFGQALAARPGWRDRIVITSKCGVRLPGTPAPGEPARYDLCGGHITACVEQSLRRLKIDSLDVLLLHRPDYLMDAEAVAATLETLRESGKVRHFGVSNFRPSQVSLLQRFCSEPLLVNQVEINVDNLSALDNGTLDQCQELNMTPQAWSPLAGIACPGWGTPLSDHAYGRIHAELGRQADEFGVETWVVFLAWLMRHPAQISPIIGSTSAQRIAAATTASGFDYQREDWYRLLEARNGRSVP